MEEACYRLNKYIAECGICSRREADRLIDEGKVVVNGDVATMGLRVSDRDEIIVNGKKLSSRNEKIVLAYYKPIGIVCTEKDRFADRTLKDEFDYPVRVTYAGRLDKESEGLLLMTNDGELINCLMRGVNAHEKEYIVKVNRPITDEFVNSMESGIYLEELEKTTRECKVELIGTYTFRIVLTQGLNRQIRRMCEALGYKVTSLKRVRVANVKLGELKPGEYRKVDGEELKQLLLLKHTEG